MASFFSSIRQKLYIAKYTAQTIYNNFDAFISTAVPEFLTESFISAVKAIAKACVYTAKLISDVTEDILEATGIIKVTKSSEVDSSKLNIDSKSGVPQDNQNNQGFFKETQSFVVDTWREKDSSFLGEVRMDQKTHPIIKVIPDVIEYAKNIVVDSILIEGVYGIAKGAKEASMQGVKAAYIKGLNQQEQIGAQLNIKTSEVEGYENVSSDQTERDSFLTSERADCGFEKIIRYDGLLAEVERDIVVLEGLSDLYEASLAA